MLDSDTKRRIDTARDILVGKVPDPKSQVEQITIALIYKFMDDMDAQAEELGGKRKFFAKDYARYGWAKLMRSGLGGHETLNLYAEALTKMPENPGIPTLFRDIFKNAFLPYRDPETLRAFLKIIDEFEYDHSERLGDAFEYLLSVLGSQGDAGQFRTPRHIIDFIVRIVDPKKSETILDPACGTAGFLISAYKHIVAASKKDGGKGLTPDERKKLAAGITGYDISPDMVRLSRANMYLHGFADPHIHEYDTLTSQEKWNETADVILANPPFMSPKGGIKPHNRFSVQSKRSEVLFVDYMAEHLTPNGRAGIIVPEGIIFQSQTAYADLRKMLVNEYLVAVVSLPQGVFNPYSGVKTSILILDKTRSRRADSILFLRVNDDGHDLGATRKRTGDGDLPHVERLLREWFEIIDGAQSRNGFPIAEANALLVTKQAISASSDSRLTADTYRTVVNHARDGFPWVALDDILVPSKSGKAGDEQSLPVLSITMKNGLVDQSDKFKKRIASTDISTYKKVSHGELVVGFPVDEGVLGIQTMYPSAVVSPAYDVWGIARDDVDSSFFELLLRSHQARARYRSKMRGTAGRRRTLEKSEFLGIEFPLPPLEVQREIVAEIEGYQKVIDGARAVLDHYRPRIPIRPEWPMVELADVLEGKPKNGYSGSPVQHVTSTRVLSLSATTSGKMDLTKYKYLDEAIDADSECWCQPGDIYLQRGNTRELVGTSALFDTDEKGYVYPDLMIRVRANPTKITIGYLLIALKADRARDFMSRNAVGAAGNMPKINQDIVSRIPIPLPPLAEQEKIVAEIEAEQRLVAANPELITRFEKKIQAAIARVWGVEGETLPISVVGDGSDEEAS